MRNNIKSGGEKINMYKNLDVIKELMEQGV